MTERPTVALSSWALHRTIGQAYWNSPASDVFELTRHSDSAMDVMDLPAAVRDHGFDRLELCHFHLASRHPSYLEQFRRKLEDAGVVLQTLLIDDGDLTSPVTGARDMEWIASWLEAAKSLQAQAARVIAGKQTWSTHNLMLSRDRLQALSAKGVHLRIENWFDLLQTPEHVHELLDSMSGTVGLCVDLGNWTHPRKYERLGAIAGRAETCHAKCEFVNPLAIDAEDFDQSLNACFRAGFGGPFVIVYCGLGESDWPAIELQRSFLLQAGIRATQKP